MTYTDNFKKILRIHKSLLLHDLPDDIIPDIFEYTGDLNESINDMYNNNCFYAVVSKRSNGSKIPRGHWCHICGRYLQLKSSRQLYRHIISSKHKTLLKKFKKRNNNKRIQKYIPEIKYYASHSFFPSNATQKLFKKFEDELEIESKVYKFQIFKAEWKKEFFKKTR